MEFSRQEYWSVSDVKVAVGFGRKSRVDLLAVYSSAGLKFLIDDLMNEILAFSHFQLLILTALQGLLLFVSVILRGPKGSAPQRILRE